MGKRYYLIDFENVGIPGIEMADTLTDNDCVILFSSRNSARISTAVLAVFNETKLIVKEVPQGSQSVDMHLVSYLGYLIGKGAGSEYIIVSKDQDFDSIIHFWDGERGIKIKRQIALLPDTKAGNTEEAARTSQNGARQKPNDGSKNGRTVLNNEIMKELSKANLEPGMAGQVASKMVKLYEEPNRKQKAHGVLVKEYGQARGLDIYNRIKKYL